MKRTAIYLVLSGLVASPSVFASVDQAISGGDARTNCRFNSTIESIGS